MTGLSLVLFFVVLFALFEVPFVVTADVGAIVIDVGWR